MRKFQELRNLPEVKFPPVSQNNFPLNFAKPARITLISLANNKTTNRACKVCIHFQNLDICHFMCLAKLACLHLHLYSSNSVYSYFFDLFFNVSCWGLNFKIDVQNQVSLRIRYQMSWVFFSFFFQFFLSEFLTARRTSPILQQYTTGFKNELIKTTVVT